MPDLFKNKIFTNTFFLIILAELLSFLGYYYPPINSLAFFIIVILTISVSLYRLEYGLYILLVELFIGSFGYLFYFESGQTKISIRLALWLIVMSVWLAKIIIQWLKTKKLAIDFFKSREFVLFMVLLIFIGWGLINGLLNSNSLSNIFFDANNWLYFLIIFPVYAVRWDNSRLKILQPIFLAAITWLSVKTISLAYVFTHNFHGLDLEIYGWIRADRLGEITQTAVGFSRIFMQSQIFILIGFFSSLVYLLSVVAKSAFSPGLDPGDEAISRTSSEYKIVGNDKKKLLAVYLLLPAIFLSAILISFSRSFWLGLVAGGAFIWLIAIFKLKIKFKQFIAYNSIILFSLILSFILTLVAIKFPCPTPYGGISPSDLLSQRVTQTANEAGASSRWQLLLPLWQEIRTAPILGRGLGATVTYKTNDPRVLATRLDGLYTTYSFEWGWLDVWLKLGLFGLLAYLFLLIEIIKRGLKKNSYLSLSLVSGLIVLLTVNIFSPYINHPLGIGYIIMAMAIIDNVKCKN